MASPIQASATFLTNLVLLAITIIPVLVTGYVESLFTEMIFLWLFVGGSLIAWADAHVIQIVFNKITEEA